MIEARCRSALLVLVTTTLALTGCDNMIFVELGRGQIGQVTVDRTFPTGLHPYEGCPSIDESYRSTTGGGRIVVAPLSEGCLLAVHIENAELLSKGTMSLWADALVSYDMSALIAIDVAIDQFVLDAGRTSPLGHAQLRSLSVALDERVLVDEKDLAKIGEGEDELRIAIPQELVDRFERALDERVAFTGTLDIRIVLRRGVAIPRFLHIRTLLQPFLLVDGWKAKF